MPTGIILKSASHEVSDEVREKNLAAVVESAGYEVAEKEAPAEPTRAEFKTEEEFESAHVAWQDKGKAAEKDDDEEDAAPRKSRKTRAIERATAPLLQKIKELEAKTGIVAPVVEKKDEAPKEAQRPKRTEFAQTEEGQQSYEDALLAWGVEKATKEKYSKEAEQAERTRQEELLSNYGAQIEEAKEAHEDWDDLQEKFETNDVFIGHATQLAILELENGAEVTYYLMRHPVKAAELGKMSQVAAVMEVGRLSVRLKTGAPAPGEASGSEAPAVKQKPKVPAPVRTVSTGGSSAAPSFAEIAAKPNYPGKARDLRAALTQQ